LKLLELWKKKWKMSFNVDKCMVVSVTLKRTAIYANYILHGKKHLKLYTTACAAASG